MPKTANLSNTAETPKTDAISSEIQPLTIYTSCVLAVRYFGAPVPRGDAKDLTTNSTPVIGGVIKLKYPKFYHLAYIKGFTSEGFVVLEGNYKAGKLGERIIKYNDPAILGFWSSLPLK